MRLARWASVVSLVVASSISSPLAPQCGIPAAYADTVEERSAAAQKAFEELSSPDDAIRTKAAERLAADPWFGAAFVARDGEKLDERAWSAAAAAFVRAKCSSCAFRFVVAAHKASETHRKRLLALARALDPEAGIERTPEEVAATVNRLLDEAHRARCGTGYSEKIALLGHAAVEPLLATMRDGDPKHPGGSIACWSVGLLAEKEDLPAIRELLLAGKTNLVQVVERLQEEGVPEATDALLDAVAAGRLDADVTTALARAPDKKRVLAVVNAWIAKQDRVADRSRANLASMFAQLDARESVPLLESWIATSKEPDTFVSIAGALVRFGERKGVGLLVRIASERVTWFPCRPSTPEEQAAAASPGRLCPEGFAQHDRAHAAQTLTGIAGKEVFDVPEDWIRVVADQGRDHEPYDAYLDRAAAAFRAWWEASRDELRFDAETKRWVVGK